MKNPSAMQEMQETQVGSLGQEDPLEEGTATHSSILAWRTPMDREAWRAAAHGVTRELDTTEVTGHTAQHTQVHTLLAGFLGGCYEMR